MSEESTALAIAHASNDMTREQIEVIKDTIAKGATDTELAFFIEVCKKRGLDPLARQIFLVKRYDTSARREVATPQISIDGQRAIAERTGEYEGQTPPMWCGPDNVWVDVWLSDEPPHAAKVGVYRKGFREPMWGIARWKSFVVTTKSGIGPMWRKMPDIMLLKCAESQAMRKAFPEDLSGLYTPEEMAQADNAPINAEVAQSPARTEASDDQANAFFRALSVIDEAETQDELDAACASAREKAKTHRFTHDLNLQIKQAIEDKKAALSSKEEEAA